MQQELQLIANAIKKRKTGGGTVFICGNGGSAATAEHFANDLFAKGVRAVCLNSNTAIMTMIANDYGYEYVFSKQLEVFADPGDLVVTISTSGMSANINNIDLSLSQARLPDYPFLTTQETENTHLEDAHRICEEL